MSLADPMVFSTINEDGSAEFTIAVDEDNHKFSISPDGDRAMLSYEESLTWRGTIETSEPRGEVWRLLMQSDEMTEYLEDNNLRTVRRVKHD